MKAEREPASQGTLNLNDENVITSMLAELNNRPATDLPIQETAAEEELQEEETGTGSEEEPQEVEPPAQEETEDADEDSEQEQPAAPFYADTLAQLTQARIQREQMAAEADQKEKNYRELQSFHDKLKSKLDADMTGLRAQIQTLTNRMSSDPYSEEESAASAEDLPAVKELKERLSAMESEIQTTRATREEYVKQQQWQSAIALAKNDLRVVSMNLFGTPQEAVSDEHTPFLRELGLRYLDYRLNGNAAAYEEASLAALQASNRMTAGRQEKVKEAVVRNKPFGFAASKAAPSAQKREKQGEPAPRSVDWSRLTEPQREAAMQKEMLDMLKAPRRA